MFTDIFFEYVNWISVPIYYEVLTKLTLFNIFTKSAALSYISDTLDSGTLVNNLNKYTNLSK